MKAVIGQKIGMTHIYDDQGRLIPATLISVQPNVIIEEKDRQVTIAGLRKGRFSSAQNWIKEKTGFTNAKLLTLKNCSLKDKISVENFEVGEKVIVSGQSKGKGFQGTIKRHNFARGPVSHGSHNIRQPGSIGAQQPQRVLKGQKMAGRMGGEKTTIRGLRIIAIDKEKNILVLNGPVPGNSKGTVIIRAQE